MGMHVSHIFAYWMSRYSVTRHIFHRRVCYRMLSKHYACIQRSGIILTLRLPLCKISFLSWLPYSITHSPSLFDALGTVAFTSENLQQKISQQFTVISAMRSNTSKLY